LRNAEERLGELDSSLRQLEDQNIGFQDERAAQQELIERLEFDLAAKDQMMNAFDRNADRLHDLSRSLRDISGDSDELLLNDELLLDAAALSGAEDMRSDTNDSIDAGTIDDEPSGEALVLDESDDEDLPKTARRRYIVDLNSGEPIEYLLSKRRMTIGRSKKSDICIRDVVISRTHALLLADETRTVIADAGSTNGILVNQRPVGRVTLNDGDIVSLGGQWDLKYVEKALWSV